ncbi:hypothetical protein ACFVW1_37250 [Streptomyces olivochromogenes]|uniref:hypothetical protein n=1 Tax=Streptomyces olivochromogenes TaxID=1963 RepID=UPI0036DE0E33
MTSVVLVHGTGVRADGYKALFEMVSSQLAKLERDVTLVPCFWGAEHGAELSLGGASLPVRGVSPGMSGPEVSRREEEDLASWALLEADPLAELRILRDDQRRRSAEYVPVSGETPAEELGRLLRAAGASDFGRLAVSLGLTEAQTEEAAEEVAAGLEVMFADSVLSVDVLRRAAARSLVAAVVVRADEAYDETGAGVDGDGLDVLLGAILAALGEPGAELGVVSDATRPLWLPLWRATEWTASWRVRSRRVNISENSAPPIGDILRYQVRGDGLRDHVARVIRAAEPPVVVLAHSLGGIACVELMASEDLSGQISALVTVGSQAPLLYELDALAKLPFGTRLPAYFPRRWLNVYDPRDPLAYAAEGVFGKEAVTDKRVNTRRPLLRAHSAYWSHKPFYRWLDGELFA